VAEEKPSHYIRNNVWFASQPVEEPERPKFHDYILEMMHADEMLIYASDYPHWDGDDPTWGCHRWTTTWSERSNTRTRPSCGTSRRTEAN